MELSGWLGIGLAVLVGAVIVLRVIAPKTENSGDDQALSLLEKFLSLFGKNPPKDPE